jgi:hypothetical protein
MRIANTDGPYTITGAILIEWIFPERVYGMALKERKSEYGYTERTEDCEDAKDNPFVERFHGEVP